MKTKYILFIVIAGLITLSFSFVSIKESKKVAGPESQVTVEAPAGGIALDDAL
jgi:hypothetical protein